MNLDAIEKFKKIYSDIPEITQDRGRITEADTRSNILDRILHEVCEWPRTAVDRETYINDGFIDFLVKHGRPIFILEAKAEGETFFFPHRKNARRKAKIKSLFSLDVKLKDAILQVQRYCGDKGAKFAVVSNGYSYIIFRAIIEGSSWLDGSATIFYDYNDIKNNFTEFWNLLSYEAVVDGYLESEFRFFSPSSRDFHRPIDSRADADAAYGRNPYATALKPFIDKFFGDIAEQDTIELLKNCYVYSSPIQYIDKDLNLILRDQIPGFARGANHININGEDEGDSLGDYLRLRVDSRECKSAVVVLMGGIGAGKTTYCRRFFRVVAPELVVSDGAAVLCFLNFLGAPDDEKEITVYAWRILAEAIRKSQPETNDFQVLSDIFSEELVMVRSIFKSSSDLERKICDRIFSCASNDELFCEKSLLYLASKGKMPIIVFDNLDQLKIDVQAQIFTLCQRITSRGCCFSILAIREESFSTAMMQKHITAYSVHPYHLSSPRFKNLLGTRIDFAAREASLIAKGLGAGIEEKIYGQIVELFRLLRISILGRNHNIIRLVESIAYGNMRLALRLFNSFVTSGATDISKIISFFLQGKGYTVPFHEFTKSIMLGEYRFYKESRSPIINLFNVVRSGNSSHFTALRILKYTYAYSDPRDANSGFVNIHTLIADISDIFGNEDDCRHTIQKLISLEKQLLELNTRRTDSLDGASEIRITTSGIYYLDYLIRAFSYLDLVWQDTPFTERGTSELFASKILMTDMYDRFDRVDLFLQYLTKQEDDELSENNLKDKGDSFWGPFMPGIVTQIQKEKSFIRRKLRMS